MKPMKTFRWRRLTFLAVGYYGHRRGEDVEQLAVWDVDKPDEAWHHMKIPEKIGVDLYVPEKLG